MMHFNLTAEEVLEQVGEVDPRVLELAQQRAINVRLTRMLQQLQAAGSDTDDVDVDDQPGEG